MKSPGQQADSLPDDPGQELLPIAKPQPPQSVGVPQVVKADLQTYVNNVWTLSGNVEVHYGGYTLTADKVSYNKATTDLTADGHIHVTGGAEDISLSALHGEVRLNMHTARFFDVQGTMGIRRAGRTAVFSTPNPFLFSGRVLLQLGEGRYKVVDGTMTNCRLPRPDWQLIAHSIDVADGKASAKNTVFKLFGVPVFYIPYLRHPVDETGRESGLLIPVLSNSTIKGFTFGEQAYFVLNRSMDMVIGAEYFSKRGFAPNGDFRYRGAGLDFLNVRWNALLDRGIAATPPATGTVNQGGMDIAALGRRDFSPSTHMAADVEYLSRYVYKLVFNDNYEQAVSSEVKSTISVTNDSKGYIPSAYLSRLQNFASSSSGDEVRIIHLPSLRFDALDRPLGQTSVYWGLGSSMSYLNRSEPGFHARNVGRFDLYPHISVPLVGAGWSVIPEAALRETFYTGSQNPDLTGSNSGTPTISHDPLSRSDIEASVDMRPPALERDFLIHRWNRRLRHVIEPEITYNFVGGIGVKAHNVLFVDTTDTATNTNEVGYSLTQRLYARPIEQVKCDIAKGDTNCPQLQREWASWQVAQKFFIDPKFGGALIPDRRNIFDPALDLTGISFLTTGRNLSPIISRLRFEAIQNLRLEWDMDYDPRMGRIGADNLYAGYSWGNTTIGVGHSLLNAVDEEGSEASIIQSQQIQPFINIGQPNRAGFNLAANGGYDFVNGALQYAGVQAIYNWNCCGLSLGYRRFVLGTVRDETQYLYSFTLANFGSVGDIRRSNTVFRDPTLPPAY
ncbi:MAG: LPS assembly protein LptD [Acidobacteriota bacterium]|nr:LPS assembly protein LptD [Acidobacteriota bacterium]